ncbi:MAG TPA: hypothetical protein VFR24_05445 [Candidatus Angelobacter sp.]|nr:hypothetical protein [Candidatus Angelobacter sp.]
MRQTVCLRGKSFMSLSPNLPLPEESTDSLVKEKIVNTRVSENEYQELEKRALAAGKRLSTWMRDVLLRELDEQEPLTLLLAEILGIRMILLNVLEPLARGQSISPEESEKRISTIDLRKVKRARERMAQLKTTGEGV